MGKLIKRYRSIAVFCNRMKKRHPLVMKNAHFILLFSMIAVYVAAFSVIETDMFQRFEFAEPG